jgi:dihydroxy-acid dehydratase
MYTANTLASAAEALGMTLPGSSSFPAEYEEKRAECDSIGDAMRNLLEKNILPRDIMTRSAFENAIVRSVLMSLRTKQWLTLLRLAGTDHDLGWLY